MYAGKDIFPRFAEGKYPKTNKLIKPLYNIYKNKMVTYFIYT